MSLRWDLSKCENWQEMQDTESGITDAIIWMTIAVDLGEITEKNWKEFAERAAIVQALGGPYLMDGIYVTDEMIRRRIGLTTNVANASWSEWIKRWTKKGTMGDLVARQREVSTKKIAELESA